MLRLGRAAGGASQKAARSPSVPCGAATWQLCTAQRKRAPAWLHQHSDAVQPRHRLCPRQAQEVNSLTAVESPLRVLQTAQPVDRLRYQAKMVFERFDSDGDGRLSADELTSFFTYASRKVVWSPGLAEVLLQVQAAFSAAQRSSSPPIAVAQAAKAAAAAAAVDAAAAAGVSGADADTSAGAMPAAVAPALGGCDEEEFIELIRRQVAAVSCSPAYQSSALRPDEAARLEAQKGINRQELFAAKWVFGLLDWDSDGKLLLSDLERAQGIEEFIVENQLEDADADDDGAINFEEFLASYAKPKPVGRNIAIMLANTLIIWFILQLPIDTFMKTLAVAVLLLRPQLVSKPVIMIYEAVQGLLGGLKAQREVASSQRAVWRAT